MALESCARGGVLVASMLGSLAASDAFAQTGVGQLLGQAIDASTHKPVARVVVTATSPQLQGQRVVVTDAAGNYRIPQLGRGTYTLRFENEAYQTYVRDEIELQAEQTVRLNVELLPEALGETVVVERAPTVDVGSTTTGAQISADFIQAVPLARGQRSFESVALVAPGVQMDFGGIAIGGATSPENQFLVDGLSTNQPISGLNGSPLNVEFVDQVTVITGGFMPEYGRATGGTISAFTKSGGNEFHGSVFGTFSPGGLVATTPSIYASGTTFSTNTKLYNRWDAGGTLGGYLIKDHLWFFIGFDVNQEKNAQTRTTNYLDPDPNAPPPLSFGVPQFNSVPTGQSPNPGTNFVGPAVDPATGFTIAHAIPGTDVRQFANSTGYQYIAKLTYLLNPDQRFSLGLTGQATSAYGFPYVASAFTAAEAKDFPGSFLDLVGKWSGSFLEKRLLVDVTAGWHHETSSILPRDGSAIGSSSGQAGVPRVFVQNYHNLTEFTQFYGPAPSQCTPVSFPPATDSTVQRIFYPCPFSATQAFLLGGNGFSETSSSDNVQGNAVVTWLVRGVGTHVVKAGVSIALMSFAETEAWSGQQRLVENATGRAFYDAQIFGVLIGPDVPAVTPSQATLSTSTSIGGFIQDSWSILDKVTLNIGVRYDVQNIYGADGALGMTLPNQWSPRIGVIWDPTYRGRSKIYANFGTYYENVPLLLANLEFPGYRQITSRRSYRADQVGANNVCNPIRDPNFAQTCTNPANLGVPRGYLSSNNGWSVLSGDKVSVDPDISAQSSSEVVVGGEYEIFANARIGATYTRRWMNRVVEDMSNDEANTYFVGNPGYGIAANFPKAVRNYTAVTVSLTKSFAHLWQAQLSYTYQSLVGNYEGLILTGFDQLGPNLTAAFDLRSLLPNTSGRLPGDLTHTLKAFGSYEWVILPVFSATFGGAMVGNSGSPYSYLGAHEIYGPGIAYILPRGNAGTLPWVWEVDLRLGLNFRATQNSTITFGVDVFNILNSAQYVTIDQNYTFATVLPIINGTAQGLKGTPSTLRYADHNVYSHIDDSPNFGKPTAYQLPRTFRFSARVSF